MFRIAAAVVVVAFAVNAWAIEKADKPGPQIGHMVFFKLKASSPENREKLVAACKKYLSEHEGTVFFASGPIGEDFKRDVNDRDWDVALHLVFKDKPSYEKYAVAPRHKEFIAEQQDGWEKVRVFDSLITPK